MNEDDFLEMVYEDRYAVDDEDYNFDFEEEAAYNDYINEQFEIDSALASAGWGTDEDYGYFGENE